MVQRTAAVDRGADVMCSGLYGEGFERWPLRIDSPNLVEVARLFESLPGDRPGYRIDPRSLIELAAIEQLQTIASGHLGTGTRAVRAVLFDKHDGANWALGWHQDRAIEVAERADVTGYGPFTLKQGRLHVAPPISLVERMMTIRLHLDAVDIDNGPLVVAPGSHRLGFVSEKEIDRTVVRCGETVCLADIGTVWLYTTSILHRSSRAMPGRRRRVIQLDYAAGALPGGLKWAVDFPRSGALEGRRTLA